MAAVSQYDIGIFYGTVYIFAETSTTDLKMIICREWV